MTRNEQKINKNNIQSFFTHFFLFGAFCERNKRVGWLSK